MSALRRGNNRIEESDYFKGVALRDDKQQGRNLRGQHVEAQSFEK